MRLHAWKAEGMNRGDGGRTSILVPCEDRYEAQKLASLVLVRDSDANDAQTFIDAVVNIVGNEVIISLTDGSSHSILLQDGAAADAFADFIQSVTEKRDVLLAAVTCTPHGGDGDSDSGDSGDNSDSNDGDGGLEAGTRSAVKISKGPR